MSWSGFEHQGYISAPSHLQQKSPQRTWQGLLRPADLRSSCSKQHSNLSFRLALVPLLMAGRHRPAALALGCAQFASVKNEEGLSQQLPLACVQVLSDSHLEFSKGTGLDFPVAAPNLCLLGDIGRPGTATYRSFLHAQAERFGRVFVLKGNHSCYGQTVEEADSLIAQVCASHPSKLFYLSKTTHALDQNFVILGCTLWSHVTTQQRLMVNSMVADHRYITNWSVKRNNQVHAAELEWLESAIAQVKQAGKQAIVMTHHAPACHGTSAPEHENSPISSAFGTDLEYLLKPPVVLWMFGHTHFSSNQQINGVQVCSNQVGYPNEGVSFDPAFTVQVSLPP